MRLLRNYAGMGKTGAIERMLMTEAADRLERNEMDIPLNEKLKEDKANAYRAMCHIGESNDIWQNEDVYNLAKGIFDIITKLEKEETKNVSERN